MKEQNDNQQSIDVTSLLVRGVQQEKRNVVENSFMRNIYFQAMQLIQAIVESDSKSSVDRLVSRSERHNVIAFTGRRGTGKTSAMISFANFLQDEEFLKKHQIENARFYSLTKHIDASMLKDSDYLLRSIISEMYLDMRKKQERNVDFRDESMFRKLRSQFIDILQDYNAVSRASLDRNNAENELEAQTDWLYIKSCMEKLVKDYLACMLKSDYRGDSNNAYLVICIDDIDMAKGIQSRIVSEILLYLMIPNVIVLVTAEFSYLKLALQKDFYQSLVFGKEESPQIIEASSRQALNYLQKIVPSDMRITMPSWKKVDYRELYPCIIDIANYKKMKRLAGCASVPFQKMKPKEFIFFLLAKRTNCLLDLNGHKLHFMEPESLRDLYDKFYLLYNMESLSVNDSNKRVARLKNNRKILLDYLYFKMKPELDLSPQEAVFAEDLLSLPIERRGKRIWEYYFSCLQNGNTTARVMLRFGQDFYKKEVDLEKERYFCMGEVFRVMFTASRIGIFGKDFVKLLLASYSFNMPQYIETFEHGLSNTNTLFQEKLNRERLERFNEMFRASLLGQWIGMGNGKGEGTGLSLSIPFENVGTKLYINPDTGEEVRLDWERICLLSLLSTYILSDSDPEYGLMFDFSEEKLIIECLDITALPINLMHLQNTDVRFRVRLGWEAKPTSGINNDFKTSLTRDMVEMLFIKRRLPKEKRLSYLEMFEQLDNCIETWRERTRREPVPMSFMLKHIDMTYNILKRAMIRTYYSSADNPSEYQVKNQNTSNRSFTEFIGHVAESYQDQMEIYCVENDSKPIGEDVMLLARIYQVLIGLEREKLGEWKWKSYSTSNTSEGTTS